MHTFFTCAKLLEMQLNFFKQKAFVEKHFDESVANGLFFFHKKQTLIEVGFSVT